MNGKDFTIGILSVTAVILLVGFLLLQGLPAQPAVASGQGGVVGEYVATTAFVDEQCEVISILDTTTQRVNFYQLDPAQNQIVLLQSIDTRAQAGGARDLNRGRRR